MLALLGRWVGGRWRGYWSHPTIPWVVDAFCTSGGIARRLGEPPSTRVSRASPPPATRTAPDKNCSPANCPAAGINGIPTHHPGPPCSTPICSVLAENARRPADLNAGSVEVQPCTVPLHRPRGLSSEVGSGAGGLCIGVDWGVRIPLNGVRGPMGCEGRARPQHPPPPLVDCRGVVAPRAGDERARDADLHPCEKQGGCSCAAPRKLRCTPR